MAEHIVTGVPRQRVPVEPSPFERGCSTDGKIHALRKTLNGPRAYCNATIALTRLGGRFDYDDLHSCLRCIVDTSHGSTITLP